MQPLFGYIGFLVCRYLKYAIGNQSLIPDPPYLYPERQAKGYITMTFLFGVKDSFLRAF